MRSVLVLVIASHFLLLGCERDMIFGYAEPSAECPLL